MAVKIKFIDLWHCKLSNALNFVYNLYFKFPDPQQAMTATTASLLKQKKFIRCWFLFDIHELFIGL